MSLSLFRMPVLAASLLAVLASPCWALLSTQSMLGPVGQLQQGSMNHVGMSRSGRFVLFGSTSPQGLYLRDIKTQTTVQVSSWAGGHNFYGISANGRYLAFKNNVGAWVVRDRLRNLDTPIAAARETNVGLSDNGWAWFVNTAGQLVLLRLQDQTQKIVATAGASLGTLYQRNWLSADGQTGLYKTATGYQLYNASTQQSLPFAPQWAGVSLGLTDAISLSGNGQFLVFAPTPAATGPYLFRARLQAAGYQLERFDLSSLHVRPDVAGLSVSADGRFISLVGNIQQGHPEWAAANALSPDTVGQGYPRVLRYDTQTGQLLTLSVAADGGPLRQKTDDGSGLWPLLNQTNILSDDGSMVEFATNAGNVVPTPPSSGGEQNYHGYFSNGYVRNYLFVDLPHSDNAFNGNMSPMTLVGNNLWEGRLTFDGVGTESFKFDAGGRWVNGGFVASTGSLFGAGAISGRAELGGGGIVVGGGAGTYKITFNDLTMLYTVTKEDWRRTVIFIQGQTQPGQDMFVRGGIDHTFAQNQLGMVCTGTNYLCAIPIRYRNTLNAYTSNWKVGDTMLDWYGLETTQFLTNNNLTAQGTVMDWTTNNSANANKVAINGVGYTLLNTWGDHYWMLDVDMDCSKTVNGWFELKSFISNGPGWEPDVQQAGTPYVSGNHFARCGQLNRFQRGNNSALIQALPQ